MRTFESAAPVLSAWMARKELTAAELSRRTGIDAGILRKIMTGRARAVSTRNLMALARFFGCSMQELIDAFSGKTEKKQNKISGRTRRCVRLRPFTQCSRGQTTGKYCILTETVLY